MNFLNKIKSFRHDAYIWYYRHLPLQKNKVILWADSFKHFGCSPKYIAKYLLKNYPDQFDIVWVFENGVNIPEDMPKEIRIVRYFSMDYLRELHTAKFVICNMRTGDAYMWHKRPDQIYIQTWHSSLRLKKIEGDAIDSLGQDYADKAAEDSKKIDLLISGCKFSSDIFRRAFWYNGKILESGTPRCDVLLSDNKEIKDKVFNHFDLQTDNKLALYAPTFRSNKPSDFLGMDFLKLKEALGHKWIVGARLHPNILADVIPDGAIPMSKYSDMQELIAASDLLITDFSSCMFDMAIAQKSCVLYAPDLEEYLTKERGLYFDIKELPFPIAKNMDELCAIVSSFNLIEYKEKLQRFMEAIGSFEDGNAAKRIADYIVSNAGERK